MEDLSPDSLLSALDEADARRQAIVLLSKIPSRQRTEKQKSVLARLKEDAKVARLEEDRNQLSDLVATLTNTVDMPAGRAVSVMFNASKAASVSSAFMSKPPKCSSTCL